MLVAFRDHSNPTPLNQLYSVNDVGPKEAQMQPEAISEKIDV